MPIPLPNLDDRTYVDLVAEAQALLPHLQQDWTNHNPSDPGIMLIELFAWLTEMILYRLNEVTEKQTEVFLELLNGPAWERKKGEALETAVRQSILALRDRYRAVSTDDFTYLIGQKWPQTETAATLAGQGVVTEFERIYCLPARNLNADEPLAPAPGHISIVVMPAEKNTPAQNETLLNQLWTYLDDRCLLAVLHHLSLPEYYHVTIQADLHLRADAPPEAALQAAGLALSNFFNPRIGGNEQMGWPFGRSVYVSEVYAVLKQVTLVDHIENVRLVAADGESSEVEMMLLAHQLVTVDLGELTAVDPLNNRYRWRDGQAVRMDEVS